MAKHRTELRKLTGKAQAYVPLSELVQSVNQYRRGCATYFIFGYPRGAYRASNAFTVARLTHHLQHRSQRPCRPPAGMSPYHFVIQRLGLEVL